MRPILMIRENIPRLKNEKGSVIENKLFHITILMATMLNVLVLTRIDFHADINHKVMH